MKSLVRGKVTPERNGGSRRAARQWNSTFTESGNVETKKCVITSEGQKLGMPLILMTARLSPY